MLERRSPDLMEFMTSREAFEEAEKWEAKSSFCHLGYVSSEYFGIDV